MVKVWCVMSCDWLRRMSLYCMLLDGDEVLGGEADVDVFLGGEADVDVYFDAVRICFCCSCSFVVCACSSCFRVSSVCVVSVMSALICSSNIKWSDRDVCSKMDVHVFCRIVFNSMDGWMIMLCVFLMRSCNVLFNVINVVWICLIFSSIWILICAFVSSLSSYVLMYRSTSSGVPRLIASSSCDISKRCISNCIKYTCVKSISVWDCMNNVAL